VTATATRCAEFTGESVASCSYHLSILAKYGFVEQADSGQGREKPWKLARQEQNWDPEGLDPEGVLAAETLTEVYLDHEVARMKDHLRRYGREPDDWWRACGSWATTTHLTLDELREIGAQLRAITDRFRERRTDPSTRPEGSRPVRLFMTSYLPPVPPAHDEE
jgi:hypothetical protein